MKRGELTPLPSLTNVRSASSLACLELTFFPPAPHFCPSMLSNCSLCFLLRFLSLPCLARFSAGVSSEEATREEAEGGLKTSSGARRVDGREDGGRADSSEMDARFEMVWICALGCSEERRFTVASASVAL